MARAQAPTKSEREGQGRRVFAQVVLEGGSGEKFLRGLLREVLKGGCEAEL